MTDPDAPSNSRLWGPLLFVLFIVALLMGAGPGLELVNPDPADPQSTYTVAGLPVIYAWGLLWFAVEVAVVVVAYLTIWKHEA